MMAFRVKSAGIGDSVREAIGLPKISDLRGKFLRAFSSIALMGMAALLLILGYLTWSQVSGGKDRHLRGRV
jgi:hypothetical protein